MVCICNKKKILGKSQENKSIKILNTYLVESRHSLIKNAQQGRKNASIKHETRDIV